MALEPLTLAINPGSASRKYTLFRNLIEVANLHFEFVDDSIICSFESDGKEKTLAYDDKDLTYVSKYVLPLLKKNHLIKDFNDIKAIGIRTVAPSDDFTLDKLVTVGVLDELDRIHEKAPLHIKAVLNEVKQLMNNIPNTPIVIVSDSSFHSTKPDYAKYYGIDLDVANQTDIKRYGFHGLSMESIVETLKKEDRLLSKTIVCHIGGGCSVSALLNGKSMDNTMGYTPLEGLMMSTRSGTIDVSAALLLKKSLGLSDDGLEYYLNKQSGLLGVSGTSNDIRQLVVDESKGDIRAKLALALFSYKIRQGIAQMAAALDGADCLVLTATIGERSNIIRKKILDHVAYLGFQYNSDLNDKVYEPKTAVDISINGSKPIYIIHTDESLEIARHADKVVDEISN
jgi:acetate kinase